MHRQCNCCGKFFLVTRENKTLCSDKCREEWKRIKNRRYAYERRERDGSPKQPAKERKSFSQTLLTLKAEGKDYVEEQKKKTIEMYARIVYDRKG